MKRSAGKEGPTFSKLHRVRGKKVSLIAETVPPRSPPMRKNRGMEVPVIGIPLKRAIRAIRDAAWKQIRRGKGARSRGRESQRERGCELLSLFFISRPRPLLLTGSIPFYPSSAPFRTSLRHPFFLSFFPSRLCDPRSSSFDSIPFPAILEIRFFYFGSPPTFNPLSSVCTELALYRNLTFLDRIV